jgi:hypothetical protein
MIMPWMIKAPSAVFPFLVGIKTIFLSLIYQLFKKSPGMKKILTLVFAALMISLQGQAQSPTTMIIDGTNPKTTISRHIYGHFSEHLGSLHL